MCLATLYDRRSNRKTGYKLLSTRISGGFETGQCGAERVAIGAKRYATDPCVEQIVNEDTWAVYPTGFHIFLSLEMARKVQGLLSATTILCKVGFRSEVAYGKVRWTFLNRSPFSTSTVVARRCKILEVFGSA